MAVTYDTVAAVENGARFYTADLHVHTFGASADVLDSALTVEAVIDAAVAAQVSIIAITDHNTDQNVAAALHYAQKYPTVLVLPGVEVSTPQGHLLVYGPPDNAEIVNTLLGQITIVGGRGKESSRTQMSMVDVIKRAHDLGAISIAAHIDRKNTGFEMIAAGYPPWKRDVICSPGLYGIECDDVAHLCWYSLDDDKTNDGGERKRLCGHRADTAATSGRPRLAAVQNSDSHTLQHLVDQLKLGGLTRYKMDSLSFEGFRLALVDPEARVRAQAVVPAMIPRILGIHLTGGFLDGEVIHFSDNLNCFIGGRGTGKSTAVRSVAYALGVDEKLTEQSNCPETVVVYCEDAAGVMYRYERGKGSKPVVRAREGNAPIANVPADAFRVEYYGQGHLAKVAEDPIANPIRLQDFLDKHIALDDLTSREADILSSLSQNSALLVPLEQAAAELPAKYALMAGIEAKLKAAETGKLSEVAARQTQLAAERSLVQFLSEDVVAAYNSGVSLNIMRRDFENIASKVGALTGNAQSDLLLAAAKSEVEQANAIVADAEANLNSALKGRATALAVTLQALGMNHLEIEAELTKRVLELQAKGLNASINELNQLLTQKGTLVKEVAAIEARAEDLKVARDKRLELMEQLGATRATRTSRRKAQLARINQNLGRTIKDYTVVIHYDSGGNTAAFVSFVAGVMKGSYFSDDAARKLCAAVSPSDLAGFVVAGNLAGLQSAAGIDHSWCVQLVERIKQWGTLHKLQVIDRPPMPLIKVMTKSYAPQQIPANQLSDGQKHTILLTIAMLSESRFPLVMDQPEDDLDNAFIFDSVVATLREVKERRQVILVTHNANIAVLGDSEQLLPMARDGNKGCVVERGSIDRPKTKDQAQRILEGGELAFRRRMDIYGH